jgi:hypothetical protein
VQRREPVNEGKNFPVYINTLSNNIFLATFEVRFSNPCVLELIYLVGLTAFTTYLTEIPEH